MAWWDDLSNEDTTTAGLLGGGLAGGLIGAGGNLGKLGGALGGIGDKLGLGAGDHSNEHKADDLLGQAVHSYDGIQQPNLGPVNLQGTAYSGDITPGQVQFQGANAVNEGNTELGGVTTDPRLREAQMRALASMQGIADSGGMTAADTANLSRIQSGADADDAARRNAILQNMHERGMGGSGTELLAQLQSSQAATDRQAQQGLDVAGMAQQRALQAIQGAGGMGGSLRSQDYGEKANEASAQDAINRFNAQNQTQANFSNAGIMNQGQMANAQMGMQAQAQNQGARQHVNDYNSGVTNQQTMTNQLQIPQQQFQNQMGVAGGKAQALGNGVNYYGQKDAVKQQTQAAKQGAVLGGIGQLGAAFIGANKGGSVPPGGPSSAGMTDLGDAGAYSGYAAFGGKVPGMPRVHGDSPLNDTVHMALSPKEVVVPTTLVEHGSPGQIGSFVKHAPSAMTPDKHKEAMLSALANIRKRHGG